MYYGPISKPSALKNWKEWKVREYKKGLTLCPKILIGFLIGILTAILTAY